MARYVRILEPCHLQGRVFPLDKEYKSNWFDRWRGFPNAVRIKGYPNKDSYDMFVAEHVEEISEKEYFKERLNGN